ncbi:MAG TPA: VOC family protein [Acidimicrobiales bacterium]|nr:VOC family protein [Acidimicrobiales bacterium]
MPAPVRLRQVVLITNDLAAVSARVERELGLSDPFIDPGVGEFGLENRVYAAGDCFLEVLTPIKEAAAGARWLARRGGADGGYMAIFQFAERAAPRQRAADLGIRIVWRADLEDMAGTHLHPSDIGAAIVSLDWADPPESWRWAGPAWRGSAPSGARGGVTAMTIAAADPAKVSTRWAEVLGPGARLVDTSIRLDDAGQELSFVQAADAQHEGIIGCGLALPLRTGTGERAVEIGGVRFTVRAL